MPLLSSEFSQVWIANAAGTLVEISGYVPDVNPQRTNADTDVTTFNAGGLPVTENHIRGADQAEFQLKGLFDPVYAKLLRQVVAARSGAAFQSWHGSNAVPGPGDEFFGGTFCPLITTITYNTGAVATLDTDLKLADGATLANMSVI